MAMAALRLPSLYGEAEEETFTCQRHAATAILMLDTASQVRAEGGSATYAENVHRRNPCSRAKSYVHKVAG